MNKEQIIKRMEESLCQFDDPCQECLEEVETFCKWFSGTEQEKKEIVEHFKTEWTEVEWISEMIEDVFSYTTLDPELVS